MVDSVTITGETFDQWSVALESQAENDQKLETMLNPDGTTTMTAKPTLGMLHVFAGEQIHRVEVGQTRNLWPKYASVALGDSVTLRDPTEDSTPEKRKQNLRNLISNTERLTGTPVRYAM